MNGTTESTSCAQLNNMSPVGGKPNAPSKWWELMNTKALTTITDHRQTAVALGFLAWANSRSVTGKSRQ
jgi:hypothetical protein